jgi:hypothetical protein
MHVRYEDLSKKNIAYLHINKLALFLLTSIDVQPLEASYMFAFFIEFWATFSGIEELE